MEFYSEIQNSQINQSKFRLFEPEFSHERIVELLELTVNEQDILANYDIDLLYIWNSYIENH